MNTIIVHGSYGKPFENWFPWLENELYKKNINCVVPTFPTPQHQNYSDWSKLLDYYYDMNIINEETIIIGHSCGAVCAAKYICENNIKIKSIITVSGYNNYIGNNPNIDFLNSSFYCDNSLLRKAKYLADTRISFISDNDPFIDYTALVEFSEILDSKLEKIIGAGHFNTNSGYTKFNQILKYIK